jgi:tetratricopeptide (TPR) repeat protein
LQTYLKLINAGTEPRQAGQQAFGDLRKLESDVKRYLNGPLPGALVRPAAYRAPQVAMRRLSPDEEAIMPIRMRSKAGVNRKKAKDVASDARRIADRFPQSFPVQLALAEAELDARNLDLAERAADAAIALRPGSAEALLYKGRVYLERGKADRKHFATARTWLAKAHKAAPEHPAVLESNYISYMREGSQIPESAIIGLEQAFTRAPYDEELRLAVVRQLLVEKDAATARRVLAPLVHSPHESKFAKTLRDVFDLLEANKVDQAYASFAAEIAKQEERKNKARLPRPAAPPE